MTGFVTRLDFLNHKKVRVTMDDGTSFPLYKKEIIKYNIAKDTPIEDSVYREIMDTVLLKRARERSLYLLDKSPKTRKQIEDKLSYGGYPDEIIRNVVEYLSSRGYLNDMEYAIRYIERRGEVKSARQLKYDLLRKGVKADVIDDAIKACAPRDELSLDRLIQKKASCYDLCDEKDRKRLYNFLRRRGYSGADIMRAFNGISRSNKEMLK